MRESASIEIPCLPFYYGFFVTLMFVMRKVVDMTVIFLDLVASIVI